MGRVVAPYGVYGWLKIQPDTEDLDSLFDYDSWWLGRANPQDSSLWRELEVETVKVHNALLVVKLVGVDDRDAAFACKGMQVAVPRDLLPPADANEYYWSDLIGLEVKNQQAVELGKIMDVFATGANDVIVVKGERERLIPFIGQVILEVDVAAKTMLVDWDAEF